MLLDTEVDLGPGHIVLDGGSAPILERGMSTEAKRSAISATTELFVIPESPARGLRSSPPVFMASLVVGS